MGTQNNRLNETVLLNTQNICKKLWVRKYLQLYTEKNCLAQPVGILFFGVDPVGVSIGVNFVWTNQICSVVRWTKIGFNDLDIILR